MKNKNVYCKRVKINYTNINNISTKNYLKVLKKITEGFSKINKQDIST